MKDALFARRNAAIDMLRGLTMLLMVFGTDLWTVSGGPQFLDHFDMMEDGIGVSDVVLQIFLFSMGISIPYALERRFDKGCSGESTLLHILSRTMALLLMGVFIVNAEGGFDPLLGYGVNLYRVLMVVAFFLIWNIYPSGMKAKKWLQACGAAILVFLAVTFRTPEGGFFRAGWWGILGLIGWAYCFCAVSYLLARRKPFRLFLLWLVLIVVNMLLTPLRDGSYMLEGQTFINDMAGALRLGNASCAIMAMGGVLLSLAERRLSQQSGRARIACALAASFLLAASAAVTHQWWIVSKILGTLPWCLYVSAISVILYMLLRIMEAYGRTSWFKPLSPSGTATLTVYMMPYVLYGISGFMGLSSPEWLCGPVGLLKCFLFSLLCVALAGLAGRTGLKLKI